MLKNAFSGLLSLLLSKQNLLLFLKAYANTYAIIHCQGIYPFLYYKHKFKATIQENTLIENSFRLISFVRGGYALSTIMRVDFLQLPFYRLCVQKQKHTAYVVCAIYLEKYIYFLFISTHVLL